MNVGISDTGLCSYLIYLIYVDALAWVL